MGFQIVFRNPDVTIFAPPPVTFGVTTVYDYVITDGQTQWSVNSYNLRVSVPAPKRRCKVYLWVREYQNGIQVNRKFTFSMKAKKITTIILIVVSFVLALFWFAGKMVEQFFNLLIDSL